MSRKIEILKKYHYLFLGGFFLFLVGLGGYYYFIILQNQNSRHFNADLYVSQMDTREKSTFIQVRDSIKDVIKKWGVQAAIDMNTYAFVNHKYGIYNCHVVMHLIGHEAVVYYGTDYEAVINHHVEFCELGYQHGAEAEVALNGGQYKEELYKMCELIKKKNSVMGCFHGAGHAFMNDSLDVDKSLKLCDSLIDENHTVEDLLPCFNSVFAELTNLVGGTDGATGEPYTGGPPINIGNKTSLEYCSTFGERYRTECLFEFSGLGISEKSTDFDVEKKIIECTKGEYSLDLESACVRSVSAVGAQHLLAFKSELEVPKSILELSKPLRFAYINGAGGEMSQYISSGVPKHWEKFCASFSDIEDQTSCIKIFTNIHI